MVKRPPHPATTWGRAASAGLEAGLSVAIGGFLGYHADLWLGTTAPWLFIVFMILGFISGMRRLFQIAQVRWVPEEASSSRSADSPEDSASSTSSRSIGSGGSVGGASS